MREMPSPRLLTIISFMWSTALLKSWLTAMQAIKVMRSMVMKLFLSFLVCFGSTIVMVYSALPISVMAAYSMMSSNISGGIQSSLGLAGMRLKVVCAVTLDKIVVVVDSVDWKREAISLDQGLIGRIADVMGDWLLVVADESTKAVKFHRFISSDHRDKCGGLGNLCIDKLSAAFVSWAVLTCGRKLPDHNKVT